MTPILTGRSSIPLLSKISRLLGKAYCLSVLTSVLVWPARPPHDWPQWGGPYRNFSLGRVNLSLNWPSGCPRELWRRPLGPGFSSIVAGGSRVYTMYRKQQQEAVIALDARTGNTVWEYSYPAPYLKGMDMSTGPGPHGSPLLVHGRIYTVGVTGKLHCLDAKTGRKIWEHGLLEEFGGTVMNRGYSASPIVYHHTIIATVGGTGHAIMAFDLGNGQTVWHKQDFKNSHSSPILIHLGSEDQLVALMDKIVVGVNPRDGELLWSHPHETDGQSTASTPVWDGDQMLFVSSAYQGGSRVIRLEKQGARTTATEVWSHRKMRVHHSNLVRIGNYVYGSNGDFGPAPYTAVDITTGEIAWRDRTFGKANTLLLGEKALVLDEDGQLAVVTLSPQGLQVYSKCRVLKNRAWTPPTVAESRLFVRDQTEIAAFDLK
jgi:outer membrane protein assembly factor BamB